MQYDAFQMGETIGVLFGIQVVLQLFIIHGIRWYMRRLR